MIKILFTPSNGVCQAKVYSQHDEVNRITHINTNNTEEAIVRSRTKTIE